MRDAFELGYTARLNGAAEPTITGGSSDRDVLIACGWRSADASATLKTVKDALDELGVAVTNCEPESRVVISLNLRQRMRLLQAEVFGLRAMVSRHANL